MSIRWLLLNPLSLQSVAADNIGVQSLENPDIAVIEPEIDKLVKSMNDIGRGNPVFFKEYGKRILGIRKGTIPIELPQKIAKFWRVGII